MSPARNLKQQILYSRILIVDDNEVNRVFIERMLQNSGFSNIMHAADGLVALEKLDSFKPDIIILDIMMPDMDGFECCREIRKIPEYQDLPILIQTTITQAELRVKAFTEGATDFISKPVYPDELCARVMVHLEKRHSHRTLELYKQRIEIELESARQLQLAILPNADELSEIKQKAHLDIASYFQPSSEVGGDFWGVKNIFPNQTALWMVDFSGHGVASALNAFRLQAYLREHSELAFRPGEYLTRMNEKMLHLLLRGQFATMFYGIIDTQANQLFYSCACSPHPVILRRKTGKAELIDGSNSPLGVGLQFYNTSSIDFYSGDTLVLYSDAVIETPNRNSVYITEEDIISILEAKHNSGSEIIKNSLLELFRQHSAAPPLDDLTLTICSRLT